MTTLIFTRDASNGLRRAVTAAKALGAPITVLVAGIDCDKAAEQCAVIDGVEQVLVADAPQLAHQLAEPMALLIAGLASRFDAIVAVADSLGRDIMPRVAAMLDVMQLSDVIEIVSPDVFRRPTYAGNLNQTIRSRDAVKLITIRASAFEPAGEGTVAQIGVVEVPSDPGLSQFVGEAMPSSDHPDLGAARVVISGGRAFGSREKFEEYLDPIAAKLGAAIGASRAAVDAGYAANDLQVGQTGKIVAPELYIACGISGAVQHLAGMKDARCIVAINSDADAPIFGIADYGLVGDIFEILPELERKL